MKVENVINVDIFYPPVHERKTFYCKAIVDVNDALIINGKLTYDIKSVSNYHAPTNRESIKYVMFSGDNILIKENTLPYIEVVK